MLIYWMQFVAVFCVCVYVVLCCVVTSCVVPTECGCVCCCRGRDFEQQKLYLDVLIPLIYITSTARNKSSLFVFTAWTNQYVHVVIVVSQRFGSLMQSTNFHRSNLTTSYGTDGPTNSRTETSYRVFPARAANPSASLITSFRSTPGYSTQRTSSPALPTRPSAMETPLKTALNWR